MKILTSFNHPYVISDLHDLLSSVEYKSHIVQPTTGCHMVWPTTSCGATNKAKFYNQCGETKYCMSSGATNKAMWSGQQSHMVQPTLAPIVWKKIQWKSMGTKTGYQHSSKLTSTVWTNFIVQVNEKFIYWVYFKISSFVFPGRK